MSQTNVIITSGSKNQIIHVPVVTSATRSATPIEIVTSSTGSVTINRTYNQNINNNQNFENNNKSGLYSSTNKLNRISQTSTYVTRNVGTNRELFTNNEDNNEVKTLFIDCETNDSREQLLLPAETYIKQEELDEEEYEEYESLDEDEEGFDGEEGQFEGKTTAKTQFKCSGCGKGFCYTGWLDRHKLSSPECRDAHPIQESIICTLNSGANDRSRPSLEGRLNELLCCPNESCNFVTHWVQSLNKHVFTSCKFGKDKTEDISSTNSTIKTPLHVCHLCNKGFNDTEQHIQHMKTSHQIKLFYQCSECKLNFDNKYESEAHIETHNRLGKYSAKEKLVSTPINGPTETTNGVNNGSEQYWLCELCNKSYLSMRSFEIHRTSCEKAMQSSVRAPTNSVVSQRQGSPYSSRAPVQSLSPIDNSVKHFKREQIEAIHGKDFRCKYCRKSFNTSFGLCNHLSRRPLCREWYYTNIEFELKKNNSLHLMQIKSKRNRFEFESPSSPLKRSTDNSSASSLIRPRKAVPARQRKTAYHSGTNSARCDKCRKVFVGKNPTVALTNHLRGSTCVPTKYNPLQKPQVVRSRTLNVNPLAVKTQKFSGHNRSYGENRFYCKLCPRIEVKNRVSLGCHLTIYHGLPQVNVSTPEGDGFRCQNCSQVFSSKYFYNLHRQDCDLTSDYVGIVSDNDSVSIANNARPDSASGLSCPLCCRNGFPNEKQLNIHQKYQCVRRHQLNKSQPNLKRYTIPATTIRNTKPVVREKAVPMAELARLNDRSKTEPNLTMCESCGRGPYNSYYYFMEHKKKYCNALKANNVSKAGAVGTQNRAKKSFTIDESADRLNESFCLNPTIPRARKTMNFANVSSPQVSHDSSLQIDANENESEEVVVSVSEVTKCSVCEEEFDDILAFIRHRLSHITEDIMTSESVDALECELCGATVHHYQRIQQHLILHLQNVQILKKKNLIEITKKSLQLKYNKDLSDDEDMDETDNPGLHCPYCKSEYKSRAELAAHIKNTCPSRYQCPNCNNTYSAKESYLEHRDVCTKNTAINKIASKAPIYKCRNCGLEFRIKQQLLWHEHACNKVYTADHSGRVEEVIERTLSCSVCGLVSDVYEHKVRHESQCLKRYLAVIGNTTEEIKSNGEQISKPLSAMDFNLTSLSNTSESSEVPEELINNLKHEFGIQKEVKVVLTAFDEEMIRKLKNELYCETDESVQYEALKESFLALVRRLIKNDEVLQEMSQESSAEVLLSRMLKYLGEESVQHNGLNDLNCFRQNVQTFLKLTIKDDTLILAYRDAESVDEAIINMLNFECELHC